MSTTAVPLPPTPALVPADHVHDLIAENRRLQTDLRVQGQTILTLIREQRRLLASVDASVAKPITYLVVDDVLTACHADGSVQQLRTEAIQSETATEYVQRWVSLSPVPNTPSAIIAAAVDDVEPLLPRHGMQVIA